MKTPPIAARRRPPTALRRAPRSRAEAAVDLVRLEFDAERLARELDQLERRAGLARTALVDGRRRAQSLVERLARPEGRP
jgi:hypothetical protein